MSGKHASWLLMIAILVSAGLQDISGDTVSISSDYGNHVVPNERKPMYFVAASSVVRPHSKYRIFLSVAGTNEETLFTFSLVANITDGENKVMSFTTALGPDESRVTFFPLGDIPDATYLLNTEVRGGVEGTNSSTLTYQQERDPMLIQTDKVIYKPGHVVKFRVVAVDQQLKPVTQGQLTVYISDARSNRLKQWTATSMPNGVFEGEIQLSDEPVLGNWDITASMGGQEVKKVFEVLEYVLPKFQVDLEVPPNVVYKDDKIPVTVRARYTYGKKVRGMANIRARFLYDNYDITEQSVDLDGDATVVFSIQKDLIIPKSVSGRQLEFLVSVVEELTGKVQNGSGTVRMHEHPYKLEFFDTPSYKPGLKYTTFLKVSDHDDIPIVDDNHMVKIYYRYRREDRYSYRMEPVPTNGIMQLDFDLPIDTNTLDVVAEYREVYADPYLEGYWQEKIFIQADVKTEHPRVNREVLVEVSSTVPLNTYTYQVIAKDNIELSETVAASGRMEGEFSFHVTAAMAPRAFVVVFIYTPEGKVIADRKEFEVDGTIQNFVNITADPKEGEPGKNVDIKVEAKPDSSVFLLGVDQSVILLKSGNDITQDKILGELEASYTTQHGRRYRGWYYSYSESERLFIWSGLVIQGNMITKPQPRRYDTRWRTEGSSGVVAYSVSRTPPPARSYPRAAPVKARSDFPETWLWRNTSLGSDGEKVIRVNAPDTITSWVITGFSMSDSYGMGVISQPEKFKVFRPFFVSTNLPYSVIRGEVLALQIIVFNYMSKDQLVQVTLDNSRGDFKFTSAENDLTNMIEPPKEFREKSVTARSGDGTSVSFMIIPQTVGDIDIKVTAMSNIAADAVMKTLLVKAEGETHYRNKAVLADLTSSTSSNFQLSVDIPEDSVPGSESVKVAVIGDIMGSAVNNLDNLLRMPYGCGEQNMLNFVPNIVVTKYLQNTNQLTDEIKAKAVKFMESGYQRELKYRRLDGSFSAFGEKDNNGSTWLTAFVARSFRQAQDTDFITVDSEVIHSALEWISLNQTSNGTFPEVGKVSYAPMQGGSGSGLALTAYTLLAFLENKDIHEFDLLTSKALKVLSDNYLESDDPYVFAIVTYVLHQVDDQELEAKADFAFRKLKDMATVEDDYMYWKKPIPKTDEENPWYRRPRSVDVEMTSYALLTYLTRGLVTEAVPIMRWMLAQMNDNGGFASTQDTVIGLTALAQMAEKLGSTELNLDVAFKYTENQENFRAFIGVNKDNKLLLQKRHLPKTVREVEVEVTGSGTSIVQVSYNYNLDQKGEYPLFNIQPKLKDTPDPTYLQMTVCTDFPGEEDSNMAVMEVTLPSGYTAETEQIQNNLEMKDVKRVETKDGDTQVVIYFDKLTNEPVCPTVTAYREFKVANQKPAPIVVYDYYDSSRRATEFYTTVPTGLCDICDGEECASSCGKKQV